MANIKEVIRLEGSRRANHEKLREDLRAGLTKTQQEEQKLLNQFGVQHYQEIKNTRIQGLMEDIQNIYVTGGEWDALLTRHLEQGIEVTIDSSKLEAARDEMNNLFRMLNKSVQAISGE